MVNPKESPNEKGKCFDPCTEVRLFQSKFSKSKFGGLQLLSVVENTFQTFIKRCSALKKNCHRYNCCLRIMKLCFANLANFVSTLFPLQQCLLLCEVTIKIYFNKKKDIANWLVNKNNFRILKFSAVGQAKNKLQKILQCAYVKQQVLNFFSFVARINYSFLTKNV